MPPPRRGAVFAVNQGIQFAIVPLVASIVRHNVYVMPNLSPEWNTYMELPHWLRDGDPRLRKSVLALVFCARLSTGQRFPTAAESRGRVAPSA